MLQTSNIRFQPAFDMRRAPTLYGAPSRVIAASSNQLQRVKFAVGEARKGVGSGESEKNVAEETEKKPGKIAKSLPPAPEKPLAGDCCGTGCVRCVWDVYYEELEAYRKNTPDDSGSDS